LLVTYYKPLEKGLTMKIIKHNGIAFKITKVDTRIKSGFYKGHKVLNGSGDIYPEGYTLTETNSKGQTSNFHNTIFTDDGINSMMIQRSRCYGIEIPNDKLI